MGRVRGVTVRAPARTQFPIVVQEGDVRTRRWTSGRSQRPGGREGNLRSFEPVARTGRERPCDSHPGGRQHSGSRCPQHASGSVSPYTHGHGRGRGRRWRGSTGRWAGHPALRDTSAETRRRRRRDCGLRAWCVSAPRAERVVRRAARTGRSPARGARARGAPPGRPRSRRGRGRRRAQCRGR